MHVVCRLTQVFEGDCTDGEKQLLVECKRAALVKDRASSRYLSVFVLRCLRFVTRFAGGLGGSGASEETLPVGRGV